MQLTTFFLTTVAGLFALVALIGGLIALRDSVKRGIFDMQKAALDAQKVSYDAVKTANDVLTSKITTLEGTVSMQEKRVWRVEILCERKDKENKSLRREVELLERAVEIGFSELTKMGNPNQEKVAAILAQLRRERSQTQEELRQYDELQSTTLLHMGPSESKTTA